MHKPLWAALLGAWGIVAQVDKLPQSVRVKELAFNEFEPFITDHEHAVVLYYVPWCHWCR